jgi:hypothetical protein
MRLPKDENSGWITGCHHLIGLLLGNFRVRSKKISNFFAKGDFVEILISISRKTGFGPSPRLMRPFPKMDVSARFFASCRIWPAPPLRIPYIACWAAASRCGHNKNRRET